MSMGNGNVPAKKKIEEMTKRLISVSDSYNGFIVAVQNYVRRSETRYAVVQKYLEDHPEAVSSDILEFISNQEDFYDDVIRRCNGQEGENLDADICFEAAVAMEGHVEVVAGELVKEDSTTVTHNLMVQRIADSIKAYVTAQKSNYIVLQGNVKLFVCEMCDNKDDFFLPDIMSVYNSNGITNEGVHVAPLFVAEVTSVSTRRRDYVEKLNIYREIGVKEYWIVDLQEKVVIKYLSSEEFIPSFLEKPESVSVSVYPGLDINMTEFMK